MDLTELLLSRIQFGATVAVHIVFPSFTTGLGAWPTGLNARHLLTGRSVYRLVFERRRPTTIEPIADLALRSD
jgi:cytochrome bd ubiquinol oxidase subunit I